MYYGIILDRNSVQSDYNSQWNHRHRQIYTSDYFFELVNLTVLHFLCKNKPQVQFWPMVQEVA